MDIAAERKHRKELRRKKRRALKKTDAFKIAEYRAKSDDVLGWSGLLPKHLGLRVEKNSKKFKRKSKGAVKI